jgi:hypothetical protein
VSSAVASDSDVLATIAVQPYPLPLPRAHSQDVYNASGYLLDPHTVGRVRDTSDGAGGGNARGSAGRPWRAPRLPRLCSSRKISHHLRQGTRVNFAP